MKTPVTIAPEALDFTRLIRAGETVGWAEATAEPVFLTRLLDAQAERCPPFRLFFALTFSDAFGADHVLWGTDSIWYGTPQWQIEAFRRFEIPEALIEHYGYAPLTRAVKEQIFGLNAARVFGVDVHATRNEVPQDYLSRIKMSYLDEGATPSHRWYGWVTR